jgi:hypothetical protein
MFPPDEPLRCTTWTACVIALSTNRERDGETASITVNLGALEGAVLDVTGGAARDVGLLRQ